MSCGKAEPHFNVGDFVLSQGVDEGTPFWMRNGDFFTNMGDHPLHIECRHAEGKTHNLVVQPFESITAILPTEMLATRLLLLEDGRLLRSDRPERTMR